MAESGKCQKLPSSSVRKRRAKTIQRRYKRMEGEESSNHSGIDDPTGMKRAKRAKMEPAESDRLLNFATAADEFELSLKRQKIPRDPMSHRIIEKRRRDRMNNCLADLSRLIPSSYHKQGQGRIEKTEIIEMAIKHINMLQQRVTEAEAKNASSVWNPGQNGSMRVTETKDEKPPTQPQPPTTDQPCCASRFYMGFKEAQDEVMRFLVEVESVSAMDPFCKKIMKHLENASKKFATELKVGTYALSPLYAAMNQNLTQGIPHHSPQEDIDKAELQTMDNDSSSQPPYLQQTQYYSAAPGGGSGPMGGPPDEGSEAKRRDKHLRCLLADQQNRGMTNQSNGNLVPLFSYSSQLTSLSSSGDPSGMGSSGYVSDLSNMEKNSPNGSTSSRDNVYKFKHNITKRFSQEGHHMLQHHHHKAQPSDTSSSTSSRDLEDDQNQLKWKGGKHKMRHGNANGLPSSETLFREGSEGGSTGNNSANSDEYNSASVSGDSLRRRNSGKPTSGIQVSGSSSNGDSWSSGNSSFALPGFILHPSGTHYMPISVHNTNISGLLDNSLDHEGGPPVFHPISIPVHFRRPVI